MTTAKKEQRRVMCKLKDKSEIADWEKLKADLYEGGLINDMTDNQALRFTIAFTISVVDNTKKDGDVRGK